MNTFSQKAFAVFAFAALNLALAAGDLQAQSVEYDRYGTPSQSEAVKPLAKTATYSGPTLSTSLPSSGRFRSGLQIGSSNTATRRTPSVPAFSTLPQQVVRARENVLQTPPSFLGLTSDRGITGQSIARLAVSRGIYGGIGFGGGGFDGGF